MLRPKIKIKRGKSVFDDVQKRIAHTAAMFKKMPRIAVGLPKDSMPYPDGTSVIMVGFWNEFGTQDEGGIPARPWLRTAATQNKAEWIAMARRIVKRAIDEDKDPFNKFALLGLRMENDVKRSIDEGAWEPNRGAYAAMKAKAGKTKPLIMTGHMRASVRYVVSQNAEGTPA